MSRENILSDSSVLSMTALGISVNQCDKEQHRSILYRFPVPRNDDNNNTIQQQSIKAHGEMVYNIQNTTFVHMFNIFVLSCVRFILFMKSF